MVSVLGAFDAVGISIMNCATTVIGIVHGKLCMGVARRESPHDDTFCEGKCSCVIYNI